MAWNGSMAVALAVRSPHRAVPAFVLVGGCPGKPWLHPKNVANPAVPSQTPASSDISDFATRSSFRTIRRQGVGNEHSSYAGKIAHHRWRVRGDEVPRHWIRRC